MNLMKRGITVGDLLIFLIIVISSVLIINKVQDSEKQAYFHIFPNDILTNKNHNY